MMNKSVWSEYKSSIKSKRLKQDIECDCLVIGGGMAGILTAYYLQQSGRDVVLVEGKTIGEGITKNTTAVITAQHDTLYKDLIRMHGYKKAKAYLFANLQAVEEYKRLAQNIDCDFEIKPSYMVSRKKNLAKEIKVLKKLGYNDAELTDNVTLPFKIKSAVKYPDMAQFHPLKFLYSIAKELNIYENTYIENIKNNIAYTKDYKIKFLQAVVATHYPFINRTGWFFTKMFQKRSYIVALENAKDVVGTYVEDKDKGFYFRNYQNLLLIGKGNHRTGTKTNAFEELKDFANKYYPNSKIKYIWANQDCVTLDSISYVGNYGSLKNVYTLTGFNLWGMTGSMVGARILCDLLNHKENEYAFAFKTERRILRKQLFLNLIEYIYEILFPRIKRCPHLGCALRYNKKEHSWDCPCHGSRFESDGKLIDNPATKNAKV